MLSRSIRLFTQTAAKSSRDVLASFNIHPYFFPMQAAGFTSNFVADFPAQNIEACQRLFTNQHGKAVFEAIQRDTALFNGSAKNIIARINSELKKYPNDPIEDNSDGYSQALSIIGQRGGFTRN